MFFVKTELNHNGMWMQILTELYKGKRMDESLQRTIVYIKKPHIQNFMKIS